jgi:4-deoxy-L-threo-5-hexosulose-uronate ketol-isomerase
MVGGVAPVSKTITLAPTPELKADYYLERREIGIINVGAAASVTVNGKVFDLKFKEALYIGKNTKEVLFHPSKEGSARFYFNSAPAHMQHPTRKVSLGEAETVELGSSETSNQRTIRKLLINSVLPTCHLQMGLTELKTGSVWNTMPPHTHDRRMEAYFYFEIPENQMVCHFLGQPNETRHIWVKNNEAVLSPPWSIHCGAGTSNFTTSTDATGSVTFELAAGEYVIVEDSSGASAVFTVEAGMLTIIEVTNFVDDEEETGQVKVLKHSCTGDEDAVLFSIDGSPVSGFDPDTCVDGTGTFQIDDGDSFTVNGEAVVTASVGSHTLSELSPMTGTSPSFEVELDAITTIHVFNVTGEDASGGGEQPGGNGGDDDGVEGDVEGGQGGPGLPDTATQGTGGFPAGLLALLVVAGLGGLGALNAQSVRRRIG